MSGPERASNAEAAGRIISAIYADATETVLDAVARRLAAGISTPGWAEAKLAQLLALQGDVRQVVARLDQTGQDQATALIAQAYALGRKVSTIQATNTGAVRALATDLAGKLTATDTRVLRWASDVYRSVIGDAVSQTAAGALARRAAAQRALDRFAAKGVTGFVDSTGRPWSLTSYTEMAVRTGTMNAHVQGTVARFQATGFDLVMVTGLTETCPVCLPWQGQVLSLSGATPGYQTLATAQGSGLFHPACRHGIDAYTPGLSTPADVPPDSQVIASFDERMRQRALERRVRSAKYRVAAAKPFGQSPELARAAGLLSRAQSDMRGFLADTGRKRVVARESIGRAI